MAENRDIEFRLSARDGGAASVFGQTQKALDGLAKQAFDARAVLGTLGAAVSAQQFVSMILSTTEAVAKYKDLADVAGTTAAKLSGMEAPARLAGTSLDSIASAVAKLGRSIGEARLGDVGKGSLFEALGIDVNDGRDAADVMVDVARALSGMKDQTVAGKVANDLLGKSFAELRPFMKELTEQGGLVSRVTNEQAEAADRFNDDLTRLSLTFGQIKINIANQLLPTLQQLATEVLDTREQFENLNNTAAPARVFFETIAILGANVAYVLKGIGTEIGGVAAQFTALAGGDFKAFAEIGKMMQEDGVKARAAIDAFEQRVLNAGRNIAAQKDNWDLMGGAQDGGKAEAAIRARMAFEKNYTAMLADANAFSTRYADAIKLQNTLTEEAFKQGLLVQVDVINQTAANEDALLQVKIQALEKRRALQEQKGDTGAAAATRNEIAQAEAARQAIEVIANAKLATVNATLEAEMFANKLRYDTEMAAITARDLFEEQSFRDRAARNVERIMEENMTEMELLNTRLAERQAALVSSFLTEQEYARQSALVFAKYEKEKSKIQSSEDNKQLGYASELFGTLEQLMQSHNRKLWEIGKAAGIARALVNAYVGISETLRNYPFPWNVAMAAAHALVAFSTVQNIRSQTFGGGGGGATPVFSASPSSGFPVGDTSPSPVAPIAQTQQLAAMRPQINVTVVGSDSKSITYKDVVEELIPALNEALANGADIKLTLV